MSLKALESKLAERAATNVQAKIARFKIAIEAALNELCGTSGTCNKFGTYYAAESRTKNHDYDIANVKLAVLRLAICDKDKEQQHIKLPWPSLLWDAEHETLRNELLAKMDLMQQLLMTKPHSTENDVPCEGDDCVV